MCVHQSPPPASPAVPSWSVCHGGPPLTALACCVVGGAESNPCVDTMITPLCNPRNGLVSTDGFSFSPPGSSRCSHPGSGSGSSCWSSPSLGDLQHCRRFRVYMAEGWADDSLKLNGIRLVAPAWFQHHRFRISDCRVTQSGDWFGTVAGLTVLLSVKCLAATVAACFSWSLVLVDLWSYGIETHIIFFCFTVCY